MPRKFRSTDENLKIWPAHACKECGQWEENKWIEEAMEKLHKTQLCFTCDFWYEKIKEYGEGFDKHFIVRGTCYLAHDTRSISEGGSTYFRGFGGQETKIKFLSGFTIETTDMWTQGDVPDRFRGRLPDNATFIYKKTETRTYICKDDK